MKIGIVVGSIRKGRLGGGVADWVNKHAQNQEGAQFELVDLKDYDLPVFDGDTSPIALGKKYDNDKVQAWSDKLDSFDAYVFVTPEYNHSIPGGFKNAIDHIGPEFQGKPLALVSYGAASGIRAVEAWRLVMANLNSHAIRNQVSMSIFTDFDADGNLKPNPRYDEQLQGLLAALISAAS